MIVGFQVYVDRQEKTYLVKVLATDGQSSLHALQDFDYLLESVTPHKCFSLFLEEKDKKN